MYEENDTFIHLQRKMVAHFEGMMNHTKENYHDRIYPGLFLVPQENRNELNDAYLNGFATPELRQHHNCSCCRHFLRDYGGLVVINDDGSVTSIWDFEIDEDSIFYKPITNMRDIVKERAVNRACLSKTARIGMESNIQLRKDGTTVKWNHFSLFLPEAAVHSGSYGETLGSALAKISTSKQTLERALKEISESAITKVKEMIAENSVYRIRQYEELVEKFCKLREDWSKLNSDDARSNYVWLHSQSVPMGVNTSIGSLLVDLTNNDPRAVDKFKYKVDPSNYMRSSAPVSTRQVESAQNTVERLGLTSALNRRFANDTDIPIENLLFVNRKTKKPLSAFDLVSKDAKVDSSKLKTKKVSLETFLQDIIPGSTSLEFLVKPSTPLVTLFAPVDPDSENLFKWDNKISWCYQNGLADTIAEDVRRAGGKTEGAIRFSLKWGSRCDFDLSCITPQSRRIYFRDKYDRMTGGELDVDMNVSSPIRGAVENIVFPKTRDSSKRDGVYEIRVTNYTKREVNDGFTVAVVVGDETRILRYTKDMRNSEVITVARVMVKDDKLVKLETSLTEGTQAEVKADTFQDVTMAMFSPNYWGENHIGNKHIFFMLDGAKIQSHVRTFFNEFLRQDLFQHRKVLEQVAEKLKIIENHDGYQLAGAGISMMESGRKFVCRVDGKTCYEVTV